MNWQAFVASLVQSLAWPAGVLAVVIVLRKPIGVALGRGVRRVKAGPVEVEFDQLQAEVREELARSPELAEAQVQSSYQAPLWPAACSEELAGLAEISPGAAVVAAYQPDRGPAEPRCSIAPARAGPLVRRARAALARLARQHDLISDETLAAIEGLSVLRDLTAHCRRGHQR